MEWLLLHLVLGHVNGGHRLLLLIVLMLLMLRLMRLGHSVLMAKGGGVVHGVDRVVAHLLLGMAIGVHGRVHGGPALLLAVLGRHVERQASLVVMHHVLAMLLWLLWLWLLFDVGHVKRRGS